MSKHNNEKKNYKECKMHINNITKITQLISEDEENNMAVEKIKSINQTIDLTTRLIINHYS